MLGSVKVILINGSFGVGKSTVARALHAAWPRSAVYDPELAGAALWRLARWVPLRGSDTDDFQDMPAWRHSVVLGTRALCLVHRGPIIVPMTFDNPAYFREVWHGIRSFDPSALAYCLTATPATVRARLSARGTDPDGAWISRRVQECLQAHVDDQFGVRINSDGRSADEVAQDIITRLEATEARSV